MPGKQIEIRTGALGAGHFFVDGFSKVYEPIANFYVLSLISLVCFVIILKI